MSAPPPEPPSLPDIKTDPRFGHYPRWPEDGDAWVHPEDRGLARRLIPSPRVWRLDEGDGPFHTLRYGRLRLRVTPALWLQTPAPAFDIGDWVEVRTRGMQNEPHTGRVREIEWDDYANEIVYQLAERGQPLPSRYRADDLKPVDPPVGGDEPLVETPTGEAIEEVDELVEGLPTDEHQKRENWW